MVCCFLCSGDPVENEPRNAFENEFSMPMMKTPCEEPLWFCGQCTVLCSPCTQFNLRKKVLGGNLDDYICCQGYICGNGCCGCKPGQCGERSCPACCLCLEVFFCNGFAVSASRQTVMDRYHLRPDPWDNRLIRCNNCLQIFSCICHVLAAFDSNFRELARIIDCIADVFYLMVSGCMTSQTAYEINKREGGEYAVAQAVPAQKMDRGK